MDTIRLTGAVQHRFSWGYILLRKPAHWLRWGGFLFKLKCYQWRRPLVLRAPRWGRPI